MGRSQRIREDDVRAMLAIMGEVAELPTHDTARRVRHALDRITRLCGTDVALSTRLRHDPVKQNVDPYALVTTGLADEGVSNTVTIGSQDPFHWYVVEGMTRPEALGGAAIIGDGRPYAMAASRLDGDRARRRRGPSEAMSRYAGADMDVAILCSTGHAGHYASLGLMQRPGSRRAGPREVQIARLMWEALAFLHRAPIAALDERLWGLSLPPRLSQVLAELKTGVGAKQIARRLGLSVYTVGDYIKAIYRHFGVSSRAELMVLLASEPSGATMP